MSGKDDGCVIRHDPAIVVAMSRASAILAQGHKVEMRFPNPTGLFVITFWTDYGGEFETPIPIRLCAEGRGPAKSLPDAVNRFANAARGGCAILALIANADLGLLQPEIAFDASASRQQHEFLQVMVPQKPIHAIPSRRIDTELVQAVGQALAGHAEAQRLRRAIAQYAHALGLWQPGSEIQCLAHLYMGVEALTKAALREHLRSRGEESESALLIEWGVQKKELDAAVRLKLIFEGDQDTYRKAKAVSDGFEHGFSEYDEMQAPAREIVVKASRYLRRAIINMLDIDECVRNRMLEGEYDRPRGPLELFRYLHGTLNGSFDNLAQEGQLYPIMQMTSRIKTVTLGSDGKYSYSPEQSMTAKLGEGVTFTPSRFEIWDGSTITEPVSPTVENFLRQNRDVDGV